MYYCVIFGQLMESVLIPTFEIAVARKQRNMPCIEIREDI